MTKNNIYQSREITERMILNTYENPEITLYLLLNGQLTIEQVQKTIRREEQLRIDLEYEQFEKIDKQRVKNKKTKNK